MHGRLVGADEHAPAPQVAQLAHGRLGLLREAHQPLRRSRSSTRPASVSVPSLADAVEEPLAELVLEAPDGLADGRLGAVELGGGPREAALGGDGQEDLEFGEFHASSGLADSLEQSA